MFGRGCWLDSGVWLPTADNHDNGVGLVEIIVTYQVQIEKIVLG